MEIAVVCRNAVLRDGLVSLLRHGANLQVAGGTELLSQAVSLISGRGVLVVAAEGLEADDWITLGELRAADLVKVFIIARPEGNASYRGADAVIRSVDGGASLMQLAAHWGTARAQVFAKPSVSDSDDNRAAYVRNRKGLTPRELEAGKLIATGMSNRNIAATLRIGEQSVKNLVSAIMRKLDCESRTQVALKLMGQPTA